MVAILIWLKKETNHSVTWFVDQKFVKIIPSNNILKNLPRVFLQSLYKDHNIS